MITVDSFAEFLRFGATLTDDVLLQAFVSQVLVSESEIIAVLNYGKEEPARIELVRKIGGWWTIHNNTRTAIAICGTCILLKVA